MAGYHFREYPFARRYAWNDYRLLLETDHQSPPGRSQGPWAPGSGNRACRYLWLDLKKMAPAWLESPLLAGFMFLATGGILLWSGRREGTLNYGEMTWRCALVIGIFQAFAILPGLSRSGGRLPEPCC